MNDEHKINPNAKVWNEKNVRYVQITGEIFTKCNLLILLKAHNDFNRNPSGIEKYRYIYKKDFVKKEWYESLNISKNTFNKDFKDLLKYGAIKEEDGIYKLYDVDTKKGGFAKIHSGEIAKIIYPKVTKSEHCKVFLIIRSFSNTGVCKASREYIARTIGIKPRDKFLDGTDTKEFNKTTLDRISDITKVLEEELKLITVKRTRSWTEKATNIMQCRFDIQHYMKLEEKENEKRIKFKQKPKEISEEDEFPF